MSKAYKKYETADNKPIQVESAIRDEDGNIIADTYEVLSNKVTSISDYGASDTQYPSAKAVKDKIDTVESNLVHKAGEEQHITANIILDGTQVPGSTSSNYIAFGTTNASIYRTTGSLDIHNSVGKVTIEGSDGVEIKGSNSASSGDVVNIQDGRIIVPSDYFISQQISFRDQTRDTSTNTNYSPSYKFPYLFDNDEHTIAVNDAVVHTTGDETISGVKTFSDGINLHEYEYLKNVQGKLELHGRYELDITANGSISIESKDLGYYVDILDGSLHIGNSNTTQSGRISFKDSYYKQNPLTVATVNYTFPTVGKDNNSNYTIAVDEEVVHNTGNETITGVKTFDGNGELRFQTDPQDVYYGSIKESSDMTLDISDNAVNIKGWQKTFLGNINNYIELDSNILPSGRQNAIAIKDSAVNIAGTDVTSATYILPTQNKTNGSTYTLATTEDPNLIEATWSALRTLRTNSELIPGRFYRITDYRCTTTSNNTSSAGNQFDIIVKADDVNKLNEEAWAINHRVTESGDVDYFANSNLSAWKLWYCLDNDTNRFDWADSNSGRGVIYRMIDEFGNDCPYDFKNILFTKQASQWSAGEYTNAYTFSYTQENIIKDASLNNITQKTCYNNVIEKYVETNNNIHLRKLNFNVFYSTSQRLSCYGNVLKINCYNNTFISNNYSHINEFNIGCHDNTLNNCDKMRFGANCYGNTFGNGSYGNVLGDSCYRNIFGDACLDNKLGSHCDNNTFGANCCYNTFGQGCEYNKFGDSSSVINYCKHFILDDKCSYLYINSLDTDASFNNPLRYVHIHYGVSGDSNAYKTITIADRNLPYETNIVAAGTTTIEV